MFNILFQKGSESRWKNKACRCWVLPKLRFPTEQLSVTRPIRQPRVRTHHWWCLHLHYSKKLPIAENLLVPSEAHTAYQERLLIWIPSLPTLLLAQSFSTSWWMKSMVGLSIGCNWSFLVSKMLCFWEKAEDNSKKWWLCHPRHCQTAVQEACLYTATPSQNMWEYFVCKGNVIGRSFLVWHKEHALSHWKQDQVIIHIILWTQCAFTMHY